MVGKRLDLLVSEVIDGSIDDSGLIELQKLVRSNPEMMDRYLEQIELHGLLSEQSFGDVKPESVDSLFPETSALNSRLSSVWTTVLPLLLLGVAIGLGWFYWGHGNEPSRISSAAVKAVGPKSPANSSKLLPASVARITNGKEMQWKDASLRIGNWLSADQYDLLSGAVEVTFDSGTVISISGPASFNLVSSNHTVLNRGSLTAQVPAQAVGFRVATPSGEIIDLSTRFSLTVAENGQSEVTVIDGLVEAVSVRKNGSSNNYSMPFAEKTSIKLVSNELPKEMPYHQPEVVEFARPNNSNNLNFIHYSFDDKSLAEKVIQNHGSNGQPNGKLNLRSDTQGVGSAVVQTDGPFGKALYFAGAGACIESQVAGISGSKPRTVAFWVRVLPGTDKRYAYAFAGWGEPANKTGKKWQVSWNANWSNGQQGAIRTEFGGGHVIGSTDLRDGAWHHVASVYLGDPSSGLLDNVKHYVDGKLENCSHLTEIEIDTSSDYQSLLLGDKVEHATDYFKGYKGWIDEFYVFDAALTPSQIVKLMEENVAPESTSIIDSFFEFANP